MRIQEAIAAVSEKLSAAGLEDARRESEWLVGAALGLPRPSVLIRSADALSEEAESLISDWGQRRAERWPLAYLTGEQPFLDMVLEVSPAVLIPRPETELLVEKAYAALQGNGEGVVVADVGTGSGNIAVAMARHPRVREVCALDLSWPAVEQAARNARRYRVETRCRFFQGDLLTPVDGRSFHLITANLPYVCSGEIAGLQPEVLKEPRGALDGGSDGLDIIRRLLPQAERALRPGGHLFLEVGPGQAERLVSALSGRAEWTNVQAHRDIGGCLRVVQAQRGK